MKKAYHIREGCCAVHVSALLPRVGRWRTRRGATAGVTRWEKRGGARRGRCSSSVRLSVGDGGPSKRGNPAGGEDGDGREPGNDDENTVTGLTVFLFPNEADLNSETGRAQPVLAAYYFDGSDLSRVGTGVNVSYATKNPLDVSDLNLDQCKVLAVVNADYSGNFENGTWTTLADLRDWQTGNDLWREAADPQNIRKTNFLMSSTELVTVTDIRNSTEASPAKAVVYVERLAARVDYRTGRDVFDVVDGGQNTVGEVEITGAALVNRLDGDVNLLKHVSDDYTEEVADAAIGREKAADGGRATNWVVDAYETADKKFGDFLPKLTEDAGWEDLFSKGLPMTASNGTEWNCLGYVRGEYEPDTGGGRVAPLCHGRGVPGAIQCEGGRIYRRWRHLQVWERPLRHVGGRRRSRRCAGKRDRGGLRRVRHHVLPERCVLLYLLDQACR